MARDAGKTLAPKPPAEAVPSSPPQATVQEQPTKEAPTGTPLQAFLVLAHGELLLASLEPSPGRLLSSGVDFAVYDPERELVWVSNDERLDVVDLRDLSAGPVRIASRPASYSELIIDYGGGKQLDSSPSCDGEPLVLQWGEHPTLKTDREGVTPTRALDGAAWLSRERNRKLRNIPAHTDLLLASQRVKGNGAHWVCDDQPCRGLAVDFDGTGSKLVLVQQSNGEDCRAFGCLLYDPNTKLFGAPPVSAATGAAETSPGSCGPYFFNADGSAFLVGERLCHSGAGCRSLPGRALGWLEPGRVVGVPF